MPTADRARCRAFLAVVVLASACGHGALPADHHLAQVSFPVFTTDVDARCRALMAEREGRGRPRSSLPDALEWSATVDEAFARAAAEDKPVLFTTFVRENADPACDV